MEENYEPKMAELSDEALYDILGKRDEYVPEAVLAAEQEMRNRKLDCSGATMREAAGEAAGAEDRAADDSEYCTLGTFDVPAAEQILEQLERECVRFEVGTNDSPTQRRNVAAPLLDIHVHPDDEAKANKIIEGMSTL